MNNAYVAPPFAFSEKTLPPSFKVAVFVSPRLILAVPITVIPKRFLRIWLRLAIIFMVVAPEALSEIPLPPWAGIFWVLLFSIIFPLMYPDEAAPITVMP
ncbi:hypothetical protein D9M71_820300 [compost metagenome]